MKSQRRAQKADWQELENEVTRRSSNKAKNPYNENCFLDGPRRQEERKYGKKKNREKEKEKEKEK